MHILQVCESVLPGSLPRFTALLAQTEITEPLPGIDAIVVTVTKQELYSIATHVFGAEYRKIVRNRSRIEYAHAGHFADAVGA